METRRVVDGVPQLTALLSTPIEEVRARREIPADIPLANIPADAELVGYGNYGTVGLRPFHLATMLVQGGKIVHVGVMFLFRCRESIFVVCYEADGKAGWIGPVPFEYIFNKWYTWFRRIHVRWFDGLSAGEVREKFDKAEEWAESKNGYAHYQLLAIWGHRRRGWKLPPDSTDLMICSEGVGRLNMPQLDCRSKEWPSFEVLPPDPLWRKVNQHIGSKGHHGRR